MTVKTSLSKQPKSWFNRKRFWVCVIFLFFVYFCFVPSRTRISVETTGVTEPLTVDGQVDYFGVLERTYIDKLYPPENNGQRLLIAACGPRVLEQNQLATICSWEEIQTHESGRDWFENDWIPLCEHLYIDPYRRPVFYDKLEFFSFIEKHLSQQKESAGEKPNPEDARKYSWDLFQKLSTTTWKKSDYPEAGKWLDEYSDVLDYFGLCVRKPNFVNWRKIRRNGDLAAILLPDVQANRAFVRCLQVRITERIGRGDIEGAWYDVMSIKHLTCHYANDPILMGVTLTLRMTR
jgi:hypothetical protein